MMNPTTDATPATGAFAVALEQLSRMPLVDLVRFPPDAPILPSEEAAWLDAYRQLLNRWDHQSWRVIDLDLSQDRDQWQGLEADDRRVITRELSKFLIGDAAVTTDLAPLLYAAAPSDEERLLLGAQIGDEALHALFFLRFFLEVVGLKGSLKEMLEAVQDEAGLAFRQLFDHLAATVRLVHMRRESLEDWVAALTLYHVLIEGYLAIGRQGRLLEFFRFHELLPKFTEGFANVTRDEVRHTDTGVHLLKRHVRKQPELARVVGRQALILGDLRVSAQPGDALVSEPKKSRAPACQKLRHHLTGIGLSDAAIDLVTVAYK